MNPFDSLARHYDRRPLRASLQKLHQKVIQWLEPELPAQKDLLDLACGTGELLVALEKAYPHLNLTGLDLSAPMLERARQKSQQIQWLMGDASSLPFSSKIFDFVTITESLHHIPDQTTTIAEVYRILRSGGILIVADPQPDHWLAKILFDLASLHPIERHSTFLTRPQLAFLVTQAGFIIKRHEAIGPLTQCLLAYKPKTTL